MKRDVMLFVDDISQSISNIELFLKDVPKNEFLKDKLRQSATLYQLIIIGEAVKNLPTEYKNKHTKIPWKNIAGMRDILIHEYSGVNLKRVWKVIKEDLIDLKGNISEIRKESEGRQ